VGKVWVRADAPCLLYNIDRRRKVLIHKHKGRTKKNKRGVFTIGTGHQTNRVWTQIGPTVFPDTRSDAPTVFYVAVELTWVRESRSVPVKSNL
jgi:hypothetical protein